METCKDINQVAMNIIMDAGDARNAITEALTAMGMNNFAMAAQKIVEAQDRIKSAHINQTNVIQSEIRGEAFVPSLLFTHAQDTLMTINSELLLSKQLLKLFSMVDTRFKKLEH